MRQSGAETLVTEEPDVLIGHVRICGGPGGQPLGLPGISATSSEGSRFLISTIFKNTLLLKVSWQILKKEKQLIS